MAHPRRDEGWKIGLTLDTDESHDDGSEDAVSLPGSPKGYIAVTKPPIGLLL